MSTGISTGRDPVTRMAAEVIGGPSGEHLAVPTRGLRDGTRRARLRVVPWQPVAAVLSLCASALIALGVLQKGYCFERGWGGTEVFWHACFSDVPHAFSSSPLRLGVFPYGADSTLGHPVGTGAYLWFLSLFVPQPEADPTAFMTAFAVATVLVVILLVVVTVLSGRRHPWAAAHVALSPLLLTVALVAPDLAGVLLVSVALWWWGRERPLVAGIVFGLAIVTKTYAVLVLLALGLLALRAGTRGAWLRAAGAAVLTALAVLLVSGLPTGFQVLRPYLDWFTAPSEYGSLWHLPALFQRPINPNVLSAIAVCGWLLALLAGALMALSTRRRPRVAEVAIVMIVIVLLTSRSVPVQASLWLVPLLALAVLPWRDHLLWALAEVWYFVMVWMFIGGLSDPSRALPAGWYAAFLLLRLAAMGLLAWRAYAQAAAREAADPEESGERTLASEPDELAGVMAGRPDAVVVTVR